jgi:hypothetical protein
LWLCQDNPRAYATIVASALPPFLRGIAQPTSFLGSGVTFSDWLVSDLSEPADLESTENLAVPVVINFGQQTTTF